jgi:Zn-dependent peptidase ImmA (M78 family)/transcriptional regulator with XRE-family HTH domain
MIGERVRHARDFCGLTQDGLAELAGVPQGRISEVEAGRDGSPKADVVAAIARATSFPVEFFYLGPLPDLPDGNFRRLKRGKTRVTRQVRAQARQIVEVVQRAEPLLTMPPVHIKPVRIVGSDDIEGIAASVREDAGVGYFDPIPNLTRAVERAGVVVAAFAGEIPDHFGFSAWPDFGFDGRPIVVFAANDPGDRQRFTIGHELGHLILHSPLRQDELESRRAEAEANEFAGALLLPREVAMEAMRPPLTLHTLAQVKATFGVSIAMCIERAHGLKLISDERHLSLRKQLTGRGWHRHEPVEVPNETPVLIRRILELVGEGQTVADRATNVKMPLFAYRALVTSQVANGSADPQRVTQIRG